MNKIAVEFNSYAWEKQGINWLRKAKSNGYGVLVVSDGLSLEAISKIKELNFDAISKIDGPFGFYKTIAAQNDFFVAISNDFMPENLEGFFVEDKVTCLADNKIPLVSLVFPIVNLYKRVEAANLIEKTTQVQATLLGANAKNWQLLCGLFDFFVDSQFIDFKTIGVENLVLNLFHAFYPERIKIV